MANVAEIKKKLKKNGISGDVGHVGEDYRIDSKTEDEKEDGGYVGSDRYQQIKDKLKNEGLSLDNAYIESFITDANSFFNTIESDYNGLGWSNASSVYDTRRSTWDDLDSRSRAISTWLERNKDSLDEEIYQNLYDTIEGIRGGGMSALDAFSKAKDYYAQFDTEESYKAYEEQQKERDRVKGADDFSEKSQYSSTKSDSFWDKLLGREYDDTYEYVNNQNGFRSEYNREYATKSMDNVFAEAESNYVERGYDFLKPEEIAIYNYYYSTEGKEKAQDFLDSIKNELVQRKASKEFENLEGDTLKEIFYGVVTGTYQFRSGIENLGAFFVGGDGSIPSTQYVSGMIREDLADKGGKVFGSSLGQVGYDLVNTTANMLPSILVGALTGGLGGALTLGASAVGNGYAEMKNLGYDDWQARGYGFLVGVSEAALQYLLGGINKLGGKVSSNAIGKLVSKFDNAIAQIAIKYGGSVISEGLEESIQTVLEPAFKALVTGEDFEAPEWNEIFYSGLLGALSAGVLEGGSTFVGEPIQNIKAKNAYGDGSTLVKEALDFSLKDTEARTLAEKYQKKLDSGKELSGTQIRMLDEAIANNDTDLIKKSVLRRLGDLGETTEVTSVADVLVKYALGEKLSSKDMQVLNASDKGHLVMEELNKDNIASGRLANKWAEDIGTRRISPESYNKKLYDFAKEVTAKVEAAEKESVAKTLAEGEKAVESKFEASESGETIYNGESVKVKKIASTKDGEVKLLLDNGETVSAKDVSFASEGEALAYSIISDMGGGIDTANEIVNLFKGVDKASLKRYAVSIPLAYKYGTINYEKGLSNISIPENVKRIAYNRGRIDAKTSGRTWSNTSRKANDVTTAKASEDGIIYEGFELNEDSLTDIQKASLAGVRTIAKMSSLEIHIYEGIIENGKRYAIVNGKKRKAPNGYFRDGNRVFLDINAGSRSTGTMLYALSHEVVHYFAENDFDGFKALADFLFENYGKKGVPVEYLISREVAKLKASYQADKKKLPSGNDLYMKAYEEVVADAMSDMLADPKAYDKLAKLKSQNHTLWQKLGEAIKMLLDKLKSVLGVYSGLTPDAMASHYVRDFSAEVYNKLQDLYLKAFVKADENFQATIGSRNLEDFADAKNTEGESLFQYKAMEADEDTYRDMLKKWGKMTDVQIDNLFLTIDRAMDIIKDNLEALDYAWEADIDDRAFSPVKPNSDKLYQVSLDFSTLCRKRILQQMVQAQLQEALNKPLTREEGIAIRDALIAIQEEGRQIEVACALCYVESARMKSPEQIKRFIGNKEKVLKDFFAGKSGGNIKEKVKKAEAEARARLGVAADAPLKTLSGKVAQEIRDAKKAAKESYKPTAEEQKLIDAAKSMTVSDFTSPEGLENLAKKYPRLFDAYTSYIRNATKSKGIESDTWWRAGDSIKIGDVLIANMNKENGLRSQSWSDFQVVHILDYIASTIELATRNTKEQAYSKVPDYVELMGNTGVMINMSLIPTATFNGSLDYDSVEGIDYKRALQLRDKYHATAGTICIGVDNVQIKLLLGDTTIDYVIPYHRSGMSKALRKLMHIPKWSDYELYQSESNLSRADAEKQAKKRGVKLLNASDPNYQKGTSFSEWFDIKEAQQIAKMENANPSDKAKQKKYGVMYGGYMAMQNAANNYLKLCAERGLSPKFSHENADFTAEENYWKLLIDRKMIDNVTGEVIEQQNIKPIFDEAEVLRILNDELERYPKVKADQDYAVRKVTEAYLSGDLKGGMSAEDIAKIMKTPVDNVTTTNVVASAEHNPRLSDADLDEYMKVGKKLHTRNRKKKLLESGKKPILTTSTEIISFMSDVIRGEAVNEVRAFAKVGARLASEILRIDHTLDVFGDYLELHADNLREAYKVHSSPKELGDIPLSDTDFERIPDYLDDFDGVLLTNTHNGKKEVHLYKETDEGYIRILAVSSNERGSLMVTKLIGVSKEKFERKYAKKIERDIAKPRGQTDFSESSNPPTEARHTANALSKGIISQPDNSVKRKSEDTDTVFSEADYAPTFYSHMGKVVDGIKSEKVGASGVVPYLKGKGVKDEEIKWSGIEAFLEGKKSVTKAELQEFVAGSQLQIEEQMSGEDIDLRYDGSARAYNLYDENGKVVDTFTYNSFLDGYVAESDEEIYSNEIELREALRDAYGKTASPRWEDYRLDGGKNYRELVFTLPNSSYSNKAMRGHWGQEAEGVLAHARIQDFVVNGKKMLFIEEIQSDWHNEGAKDGYFDSAEEARIEELKAKAEEAFFKVEDYSVAATGLAGEWDTIKKTPRGVKLLKEYREAKAAYDNAMNDSVKKVPDAPFRNNYHEYVLKRLLRMAAEDGYDSIGWTPAEIQDERWSDNQAHEEGKGKSGNLIGYTIEYDQDIPKFLRKYGKKWGATVGTADVNGTEVWSMDIPDSMKDSVLHEGQTLYSLSEVDPVEPTSDKWRRTLTTAEVKERFPNLWDVSADESEVRNPTQISGTVKSYRKVYDFLKKSGFKGTILDASSGLGYGTRAGIEEYGFDVEDIEPYPDKNYAPKYTDYSSLDKQYDVIISNAVLNVLPQDQRDALVVKMGELLKDGGRMFINVRGDDVKNASSKVAINEDLMEYYISKSGSYQKGFTKSELVAYLQDALGDGFTVAPTTFFGKASAVVTKNEGLTLYSDQDLDSVSNRTLLANALESAVQNDIERNKLAQYKSKIALIEAEQEKLSELKAKIKELSFAKGARDTEAIKKLQFEANQASNRINTYDRQLLALEATSALKGVLEREKAMAYKKAQQKGKAALSEYKEKVAKTQRELLTRYQESRKKAVDSRHRTEMRHKIKNVVTDLDKLLRKGSKERNVKLGLQGAVASALEAVNMDTVAAEERIATLKQELVKAKTPEKIQEISRKIDHIQAQGDRMASRLEELRRAYADIRTSEENIPDYYKAEASLIADKVDSVMREVGNTPLRNMTLSQLESVYNLYTMVLTTVRNANAVFRDGKLEDLQQNASNVMTELESVKKLKEERSAVGESVRGFSWNEMIPTYAFDRIGSATLTKFFWECIKGQNTFAVDISDANDFASEAREKYGYKKWDVDKIHEFTLADGRTFRVSLKHMMSIYAYSKRDQAIAHMQKGGFFFNDKKTFRKVKGVLSLIKSNEEGYCIDESLLGAIKNAMTPEQIQYVDAMQDYLTKMGEKGNEVSRVLWGIDIFKEKIYFPLKSSHDFIFQANQTAQEASLKNDGMTKETVPNASNPIVLEEFDDVWASHVNRMSQYHAFVLPIENLNKLHNYGTWNGTASMSVSTMLTARHGNAVNEYLTQFIRDLNGVSTGQGASNPFFGFVSKFKKTAVAASLSVVAQQPTAILRALSVMDAKYFVGKPNLSKLSAKWEEMKKYAPITIIKEIGGFDAGAGRQATEWINSNIRTGADKVLGTIDDVSMMGAAWGDKLGWSTIWGAVKREVKATTNLTGEELLKKAGERFTEVIVKTQVYDSTLSRSGYMRSKHDSVKMLTSFMGEPTVSFNMLYNAVTQAVKGKMSKKSAARTIGAVYASVASASVMASLIYALRDDDDDESYLEKFVEAFGGKLIGDINPLNMLPAVRDIISILDGWDVSRTDMDIFQDIYDAVTSLDSDNKSAWRKVEDLSGAFASLFGIPLKNTLRTGREIYNLVKNAFDGINPSGVGDAFARGITGANKDKGKALYTAIINGDDARLDIYRKGYKDDKAYETAVRSALRENDPRIKEAAKARHNGDTASYMSLAKEIIAEGNFSQDTVVAAINAEINSIKEDKPETNKGDEVESIFKIDDYYASIVGRDQATAYSVKEDLIRTAVANGKDREEAESKFYSDLTSHIGEQYEDGEISKTNAESMLVNYADKTEEEAASKVQYWDFKKKYPDYDLNESAVSKYYEHAEPSGISVSVYYDYSNKRAKCKGTDLNGDGKTDSGSVKSEVLKVIDSLPITSRQKDALYRLNGWAESTIYEAPWH